MGYSTLSTLAGGNGTSGGVKSDADKTLFGTARKESAMFHKFINWASRVTVDMILLVFCTIVCFGSIGAAILAFVTPEAFAYDAPNETVVLETEPTPLTESPEVISTEPPIEESPEPEPITIEATRLGVIIDGYESDVDYSSLMAYCAQMARDSDDPETYLALGEVYEAQRNLKILTLGEESEYSTTDYFGADKTLEEILHIYFPPYMEYTQYEAERLAALIHGEAGSWFVSDEHQRDVASVVINRVESDRFPAATSIVAAIEAPGQYPGTRNLRYYTDRELANAIYVLENGPTTTGVFQANFIQGPVVAKYDYNAYGWVPITYICDAA